ncbi:putative cadherin-like and PC-esterase domain-containing protein 1 isoform X2 [Apostichopus japonicus]|uniref:Putative cadherin-like and PC-esterase domain-containing protein 1 isoform X2 n=1 Tax=Stichopus japonicus TaxID=307972 RepID=A0A2G8KKR7_STIJA|nr:putative cadherin-like and PC-esterase domain-containing protein 1 isoform X2 [Apostichopus japonicus]
MPLLSAIYTHPPLNLTPTFDPENTDYYTNVPHDILSVRVWGVAMSCSCEARAFNNPATYTLGVGVNRITLLSVDVTHSMPWVISSYTLHIARLGHRRMVTENDETPIVCSLKQNCKLKFLETEDCGLQKEDGIKWNDVDRTTSPLCQTGSDIQGRWLIPCESCSSSDSCNWQQAKWQPYSCQYAKITFQDAQNVLPGKREGLTNILRVMKGLGAGFHQAVDGVHNLSLSQSQVKPTTFASKLRLHVGHQAKEHPETSVRAPPLQQTYLPLYPQPPSPHLFILFPILPQGKEEKALAITRQSLRNFVSTENE